MKAKQDAGELKKKKAAREEDARPDLEYGLGGGVPHSLSSSGRRSELDEEIFTRPPSLQQRSLMHISYAKTLMLKKKADSLIQKTPGNRAFLKNGL
ncbi:hypothetical protein [Brucella anthropi]|uniref:Uncharacterized protein n=1 Tax=Brucella anthropi TaxID=529 RepID=A0A8I0N697_BRUAN|nr:hypothetical protein [Brucella anthropi]MBE0561382.1 hypothetical protein [Brucella anthropi]MCQ9144674.1 hypothetical protein [Ochrobactrum sp. BTU2]